MFNTIDVKLDENGYRVIIDSWWPDRSGAEKREVELIKKLKPDCNVLHTGRIAQHLVGNTRSLGHRHSIETKRKISQIQKELWVTNRVERLAAAAKKRKYGRVLDSASL